VTRRENVDEEGWFGVPLVPRQLLEPRWEAVSAAMALNGYEAVIVAGRGMVGQYGHVFYVTGFPLFNSIGYGYAFIKGGESVQLVVGKRDQELASMFGVEEFVWRASLSDAPAINSRGSELAEQLCVLIGKYGLSRSNVGVVGLNDVMPVRDWMLLRERYPDLCLSDATDLLAVIKAVKAPLELELYREAAAIADKGFETYLEMVRIGRTEAELAAAVEGVVRKEGAMATIVQVLGGRMYTHPPTQRPLRAGELVSCYVEVVGPNGYWAEKGGMFALGAPPQRWLDVYETTERAYALGESILRPGQKASDIADMVEQVAVEAGCQTGIWSGHGVGVDQDRPILNRTDHMLIKSGMVISFHPHLHDEKYGSLSIDQYTITDDVPECHSKFERRLHER
jgi:Xaa-Pro aminopeptidase